MIRATLAAALVLVVATGCAGSATVRVHVSPDGTRTYEVVARSRAEFEREFGSLPAPTVVDNGDALLVDATAIVEAATVQLGMPGENADKLARRLATLLARYGYTATTPTADLDALSLVVEWMLRDIDGATSTINDALRQLKDREPSSTALLRRVARWLGEVQARTAALATAAGLAEER